MLIKFVREIGDMSCDIRKCWEVDEAGLKSGRRQVI